MNRGCVVRQRAHERAVVSANNYIYLIKEKRKNWRSRNIIKRRSRIGLESKWSKSSLGIIHARSTPWNYYSSPHPWQKSATFLLYNLNPIESTYFNWIFYLRRTRRSLQILLQVSKDNRRYLACVHFMMGWWFSRRERVFRDFASIFLVFLHYLNHSRASPLSWK